MKKCFLTSLLTLLVGCCFSQGHVEMVGLVSGFSTVGNISESIGQTFYQLSPSGTPVSRVTEGLQQGFFVENVDTLLLYATEMGTYTPGNNDVESTTVEGYDELIHRQVYQLTCPDDYEYTMQESGATTREVTLLSPSVNPNDGKVNLMLNRSNPYAYPVGETTNSKWTASVAGNSKECDVLVTINYYNCASISPIQDYEGHQYPVVGLGHLCWMAKNLRADLYGDGSSIPDVMTLPSELFPGINVIEELGHLYTWDAATGYNSPQGVCPDGWHIPTEEEMNYVLTEFAPTSLMTEEYWVPTGGTDDYGFSILPGGFYNAETDRYERALINAYFWTIKESGMMAISCMYGSSCGTLVMSPDLKVNGLSVRCVMDY